MTAKEYMEKAREAQQGVDLLEERIKCIDMMLTDKAAHLSQVQVRGNGDPQKNERLIAQKDELERERTRAMEERDRIFEEVKIMISRIADTNAQEVLILIYLEGKHLREIAEKKHYCRRQIARFRDAGMEEIEKRLNAERMAEMM